MGSSYAGLVEDVGRLIGDHESWFLAVATWFSNVKLAKKDAFALIKSQAASCKVQLAVNGTHLDMGPADAPDLVRSVRVAPALLRRGDNEIYLWVDPEDKGWHFGAFTVEQAEALGKENRRQRPRPAETRQLSVAIRFDLDFRPGADRWAVEQQYDALKIYVRFEDRLPAVDVAIGLPSSGRVNLELLWEQVEDAVRDKIKELVRELKDKRQQRLKSQREQRALDDLEDYLELHRQLKAAVQAGDEETLQEIMDRKKLAKHRPPSKELAEAQLPPAKGSLAGKLLLFTVLVGTGGVLAWANGWIDDRTWDRVRQTWQEWSQGKPKNLKKPANGGQQDDGDLAKLIGLRGGQSGDVQVSLFWHNRNDLDLAVVTPAGDRISFSNPKSKCAGRLDVDANDVRKGFGRTVLDPVENIFWPKERAPRGRYKVYVSYAANYRQADCLDPTVYTVRVVVRGKVEHFRGQLSETSPQRTALVTEFNVQ